MKYTLSAINQAGISEHNLLDKTDLVDWVMLDYVFDWQQNPKARFLGSKVWLNIKHLIAELPLLGVKDKSAISRRFKKLKELGLIDTELDADGCLFARTSEFYFDVTRFRNGDQVKSNVNNAPNPIVLEQHPIVLEQHPIVLEQRPVVLKQHSTVIQDNSITKYKDSAQLTAARVPVEKTKNNNNTVDIDPIHLLITFGVLKQHAVDFMRARKAKRLPLTKTAMDGIVREAAKAAMDVPAVIAMCAENGWGGFKAEWVHGASGGAPVTRVNNQPVQSGERRLRKI